MSPPQTKVSCLLTSLSEYFARMEDFGVRVEALYLSKREMLLLMTSGEFDGTGFWGAKVTLEDLPDSCKLVGTTPVPDGAAQVTLEGKLSQDYLLFDDPPIEVEF